MGVQDVKWGEVQKKKKEVLRDGDPGKNIRKRSVGTRT